MKHIIRKSIGALLLTGSFAIANTALAQTSEVSATTTTTEQTTVRRPVTSSVETTTYRSN